MKEQDLLVTFALFSYKSEQFIVEAVRGALSQTYSPLEIIISDDNSPDRSFEIIEREVASYTGSHEIRLNRNAKNLGVCGHINHVMEMARGQFIVVAAGDDVSLPNRVETLVAEYEASGRKAISIYSNATIIDSKGEQHGLHSNRVPSEEERSIAYYAERLTGVLGCSHAWDRKVFDFFGPMDTDVLREDVVIPFRSAALGEVRYIDEPLVLYRTHQDNLSFVDLDSTKNPLAKVRAQAKRHADGTVAIYKSRLRDIQTLEAAFPDRKEEFAHLTQMTSKSLHDMEDERDLIADTRPLKRLAIMVRAFMRGTRPRRIARWVLVFFLPFIYMKLQAYRSSTR